MCLARLGVACLHLALLALRLQDFQALLGRHLLCQDYIRGLYRMYFANQRL
jgi:hypothetical protein